jgi:CheY-like chemotaxis protein
MAARNVVLVADDSPEDRFLLMHAFTDAGMTPKLFFVRDGEEAIEYLEGKLSFSDRQVYPFPQLLLLDLKMPKVDGFDVLRWMQEHPTLKRMLVAVLTSSAERSDVNRAYDLGANSYLVKPFGYAGYRTLVERLHGYWLELNHSPDCTTEQ